MTSRPIRRGVFPGSFNPLTVAHLGIAEQARDEYALDSVELVVSISALDKPTPPGPPVDERVLLIERDLAETPWLSVSITEQQLIVDIAAGYDVVIMGADKWEQVNDVRYYESRNDRDAALSRLPEVIVADRSGFSNSHDLRLATDPSFHDVSSTAARAGDRSIMAPKAAEQWHDPPADAE